MIWRFNWCWRDLRSIFDFVRFIRNCLVCRFFIISHSLAQIIHINRTKPISECFLEKTSNWTGRCVTRRNDRVINKTKVVPNKHTQIFWTHIMFGMCHKFSFTSLHMPLHLFTFLCVWNVCLLIVFIGLTYDLSPVEGLTHLKFDRFEKNCTYFSCPKRSYNYGTCSAYILAGSRTYFTFSIPSSFGGSNVALALKLKTWHFYYSLCIRIFVYVHT